MFDIPQNERNERACLHDFFCLFVCFFSEKTSFLVSFLPCELAKKYIKISTNFCLVMVFNRNSKWFFFETFLKLFTETIAWNTCEKDLPLLQAFTEVTSKCHSYFKAEQCHE